MEESGHYYTVYLTSLAVGFSNPAAEKLATLAQMPDEIDILDASDVHQGQCKDFKAWDKAGSYSKSANEWRYLIESVLHSLVDGKSANSTAKFQRNITKHTLLKLPPFSIGFGLLLHRLGDTYAHTDMKNAAELYTAPRVMVCSDSVFFNLANAGHARDGNSPDYPYLRKELFAEYVIDLYDILKAKVELTGPLYRSGTQMAKGDLVTKFGGMMSRLPADQYEGSLLRDYVAGTKPTALIQAMVDLAHTYFGVNIRYRPEQKPLQSFEDFLNDHLEIKKIIKDKKDLSELLMDLDDELNTNNKVPYKPAT